MLLVKPIMGLIKEAIYLYRRRSDSSSTVQIQKFNRSFYFDTINSVENYLINRSKILYNITLPFIQFFVGYDVLFRIKSSLAINILDNKSYDSYCLIIEKLLKEIDDKYILEQKIVSYNFKLIALSKKYHKDLRYDITFENNSFKYFQNILFDVSKEKNIIVWRILDIRNNYLHLEGKDNLWFPKENYFYYCKIGNKTILPKYYEYPNYDVMSLYGIIQKGRIAIFDIPLEKINKTQIIMFYISYMDYNEEIFPSLGLFSHIPPIKNGYYISENYIVKYINRRITIFPYKLKLEIKFEKLYSTELLKMKKNDLLKVRKNYIKYKHNIFDDCNKEIWIINDRRDQAGDNGEYFFRYLKNKNLDKIKIYFAIEKNCSDYKRLKKIGDILDLNSIRYKKIFVIANKIITSISNSWVTNPFNEDQIYIRDLLHFDVIFLQHGIIKDDLSKYLNKFNKQYNYFITSSKKEYKSILDFKYGYKENEVLLTGLPRYDILQKYKNNIITEKKIIIIPTWRMNIKGTKDLITYESLHSDTFIFSNFFKFYNNLINNKRLLIIMKMHEYKGIFCLHPCFSAQWIDFEQNEIFTVLEKCDYQNLLLKSKLLITDYSSIFFDFGYLKKPIIYTHFDYEEYRTNHYKEGYFNYDIDGFGPICKDIKCTVDEIQFEIKNDCLLRKNYFRRIKKFFTFTDEKNSERLYNEIQKIKVNQIDNSNKLIYCYIIIFLLYIRFKIKNII